MKGSAVLYHVIATWPNGQEFIILEHRNYMHACKVRNQEQRKARLSDTGIKHQVRRIS